jgi:hypothetical protein
MKQRSKSHNQTQRLETATTSSGLSAGRITGDRSNILDTSNLQSVSSQSSESTLCSRSRAACLISSSSSNLDVKSSDSKSLALLSNILSSKHRCVRRRLITISLYLHSSGDTYKGLTSGKIGDVYEGIIEGCKDMCYSENLLVLSDLDSSNSSGVCSWLKSVKKRNNELVIVFDLSFIAFAFQDAP